VTGWQRAAALALVAAVAGCVHRAPAPVRGEAAPPAVGGDESHVEPDLVGAVHVVQRGETLYRIAKTYGISVRELMEVNGLASSRALEVGTELLIPGVSQPLEVPPLPPGAPPEREPELKGSAPSLAGAGKPSFRWPLRGVLYSRYGIRQGQRHDGIDIAAPEGTPIGAAAEGTVVYTGKQSGYGAIVILRHAANLLTLYAHASAVLVRQGQRVSAGQPIARVGHSGRTTGPHLHFEVREGTRPRDPLLYLK
jgi:lipoprotein NlpD